MKNLIITNIPKIAKPTSKANIILTIGGMISQLIVGFLEYRAALKTAKIREDDIKLIAHEVVSELVENVSDDEQPSS